MKKFIIVSLLILFLSPITIFAQDRSGGSANSTTSTQDIDDEIGLREIRIPIFSSFIDFDTENASIFSWISFIGSLATIGLVVFWIFLLVKAGVKGMQSQGNAENLTGAFKQVQSVLIGAAVTLFFPFVLSLIGLFFGIGTIFSWPKMFQLCDKSSNPNGFDFYFQYLISIGSEGDEAAAESACNPLGT